MLALRLRRVATRVAKRVGNRNRPIEFVDGAPPRLSYDTLHHAISSATGESAHSIQHALLPTAGRFLASQTYKVRVRLASDRFWTAIFKTVDMGPDRGTGFRRRVASKAPQTLEAIPLVVWGAVSLQAGLNSSEPLQRFLPIVYHVARDSEHRRYQVLQEDLAEHRVADLATIQSFVPQLPAMHESLHRLIANADYLRFWDAASAHESAVLHCTEEALTEYGRMFDSATAAAVCKQTIRLAQYAAELGERVGLVPVHGDLTVNNVLSNAANNDVRIIDWEQTTVDLPHRDLAAMTRSFSLRDQRRACRLFAQAMPQISARYHQAAFELSRRAHQVKAAAIWSVRLKENEFRPDEGRAQAKLLQARIEENLRQALKIGDALTAR